MCDLHMPIYYFSTFTSSDNSNLSLPRTCIKLFASKNRIIIRRYLDELTSWGRPAALPNRTVSFRARKIPIGIVKKMNGKMRTSSIHRVFGKSIPKNILQILFQLQATMDTTG